MPDFKEIPLSEYRDLAKSDFFLINRIRTTNRIRSERPDFDVEEYPITIKINQVIFVNYINDEYFLVNNTANKKHYQCDQEDGLIECLNSIAV